MVSWEKGVSFNVAKQSDQPYDIYIFNHMAEILLFCC